VHQLGIKNMAISTTEKVQLSDDWIQYRNWVTPIAIVQLIKLFYAGHILNNKNSSLLLDMMIHSVPGSKRLKGYLPAGAVVARKPGTSRTSNGLTRATNDVGIITLPNGKHLLIAVFIADAYGTTEEREGIIAQIARFFWDGFGN